MALLPLGFTDATTVTSRAVGSYPTFSPLPQLAPRRLFSVALSVERLAPPAQALPGSVPNGARTFLGTYSREPSRDYPVGVSSTVPPSHYPTFPPSHCPTVPPSHRRLSRAI